MAKFETEIGKYLVKTVAKELNTGHTTLVNKLDGRVLRTLKHKRDWTKSKGKTRVVVQHIVQSQNDCNACCWG